MEEIRKPKFMYIRDDNNNPIGCFAYSTVQVKDLGDGKTLKKVYFGHSVKHPNDGCDKKMARHIAEQRLYKNTQHPLQIECSGFADIVLAICSELRTKYEYRRSFTRALDRTIYEYSVPSTIEWIEEDQIGGI